MGKCFWCNVRERSLLIADRQRRKMVVVEWEMAIKLAIGGFGMVFATLVILCVTVSMTRSVVEKMEEEGGGGK